MSSLPTAGAPAALRPPRPWERWLCRPTSQGAEEGLPVTSCSGQGSENRESGVGRTPAWRSVTLRGGHGWLGQLLWSTAWGLMGKPLPCPCARSSLGRAGPAAPFRHTAPREPRTGVWSPYIPARRPQRRGSGGAASCSLRVLVWENVHVRAQSDPAGPAHPTASGQEHLMFALTVPKAMRASGQPPPPAHRINPGPGHPRGERAGAPGTGAPSASVTRGRAQPYVQTRGFHRPEERFAQEEK